MTDWSQEMSSSKARSSGRINWIENSLFAHDLRTIVGVDEAGRGACAGPLVVAAVALDEERLEVIQSSMSEMFDGWGSLDSKAMNENDRERIFSRLEQKVLAVEVIIVNSDEIDRHGLQQMNESAMRRAISQISLPIDYAITDGYAIDGLEMPSLAVWKGDAVSMAVGAASIIAKVTRDRIMVEWDQRHPEYGFARHKGYSAKAHMKAIEELGLLPIHRRSYSNIAAFLGS